ncbi:MAG: DUF6790 family protein [Anaerolineales bacterium]
MLTVAVRILMFTVFPLLLAGLVILIDRSVSSRELRMETVLVLMFAIGVAGNGIAGFFGHFFLSDFVAESIGWKTGSPFQLEMAFANLAVGLLGMIAVSRRDGFREATVIAVSVLGAGATVVHFLDIAATGNLAPGNTLQNVGNLTRPVVLVWALVVLRRTEGSPQPQVMSADFELWRAPLVRSSAPVTIAVAAGYGMGFALDQVGLMSLIGILAATLFLVWALFRSPSHRVGWPRASKRSG